MKPIADFGDIVGLVPPGSSVVLHSACAEPPLLAAQLAANSPALHDVSVYTLMPMGATPYAHAAPHLSVATFFPGKGLRGAVNDGRARMLRTVLSGIPKLFRSGVLKAGALMLQLSPPEADGTMSLGIAVDYMRAVLNQNPIVIAEINPLMPRTCGDTLIREDQVAFAMESRHPLQVVPPAKPDEVDQQIAAHVASLIPNEAVLQAGIGSLPDLVLGQLGHLHDLGIHGGIITDAVLPLLERGVVNNSRKKKFRGKSVTTMAAGTQPFYDALNCNHAVEFHPCSLTHDLETLAGIERLYAINSVLQIDLAGRANAERIDGKTISGPGGLPDFARGATLATSGASIIALRSASKDGRSSNIVPELATDSPATISADCIDYVVTEYGVARLRSLDASARARALIGVAHPDFRVDLAAHRTEARTAANGAE